MIQQSRVDYIWISAPGPDSFDMWVGPVRFSLRRVGATHLADQLEKWIGSEEPELHMLGNFNLRRVENGFQGVVTEPVIMQSYLVFYDEASLRRACEALKRVSY